MQALREEAQALGVVMSGEAATAAADFADAQNELKSALSGIFLEIGSKIVPKLTEFIRFLVEKKPEIIAFFTKIKDNAKPFFDAFVDGVGVIWPLLREWYQFIFSKTPLLIIALGAVAIAVAAAFGPVGVAALAIIGIIALVGLVQKNWETIWAAVANFFIDVVNEDHRRGQQGNGHI